jgi:hypothetical protein
MLWTAQPIMASDPPPAPQSDILTLDGKAILPSDAVLPLPPSPDLPPPRSPPPPGAKIEARPVPPGPTWIVRAYEWINNGWLKQPDHCLETTDLKQAADYCLELSRFQNWYYQSNVPLACCDPSIKPFAVVPNSAPVPSDFPHLTLTVWAFKFVGGKWVRDEKYCWSASDDYTMRSDMLAYAKKLNAIPGWCATTNAPDWVGGRPRPPIPPTPPLPDAQGAARQKKYNESETPS